MTKRPHSRTKPWRFAFSKMTVLIMVLFLGAGIALANTWLQDDWTGGQSDNTAVDPTNRLNWDNYEYKIDEIDTSGGTLKIQELSGSVVHTTEYDFNNYEDLEGLRLLSSGGVATQIGGNIALNKTYTLTPYGWATGAWRDSGGQLTNGAIREDIYTAIWAADATVAWYYGGGDPNPQYITLDLESSYELDSLEVYLGGDPTTYIGVTWLTPNLGVRVAETEAGLSSASEILKTTTSVTTNHWETVNFPAGTSGRYVRLALYARNSHDLNSLSEIKVNVTPRTEGTYISQVVDVGHSVTSWGTFDWSETLNGGTIQAKVRFSDDNETWADWDDVGYIPNGADMDDYGGAPGNRYMQYKFEFSNPTGETSVEDVTINYNYSPQSGELGVGGDTLFKAGFDHGTDADYSAAGSTINQGALTNTFLNGGKYGEGAYVTDRVNHVSNPDFSDFTDNTFDSWTSFEENASVVTVDRTEYLGVNGFSAKLLQDGSDSAAIQQEITDLEANTEYTLSFYVKGDGDADSDDMNVMILNLQDDADWFCYNDTAGAWGDSQSYVFNTVEITDGWVRHDITFTTRASVPTLRIQFRKGTATDCFYYIDKVMLEQSSTVGEWVGEFQRPDMSANRIGSWSFDNTWADSDSNPTNFTSGNAPFSTTAKFGTHSVYFNGGNYYKYTTASPGGSTSAITVSAWVYIDPTMSENGWLVSNNWSGTNGKWLLDSVTDGTFRFYVYNGASIYASANATWGEWHHLVGTYDGTTIKVYVDGVLGQRTATTSTALLTNQPLWLGRNNTTGHPKGYIDDLSIYTYAMTEDQVASFYNASLYGLGKLKFLASSNIPTGAGTPGSIEMWVKPTWEPGDFEEHYFFDMQETDADTNALSIYKSAANDLCFQLGDSGPMSKLVACQNVSGDNSYLFEKDVWHYLVATWDGDHTIKLYLDGNLVASDTVGGSAYVSTLAQFFYVGEDVTLSKSADAVLDDLRISQKELSLSEIENYDNDDNEVYELRSNQWDTGSSIALLTSLEWADNGNSGIRFQLRTAPDDAGSPGVWTDWMGSGGAGMYFTSSGETLPDEISDGESDQWMQYRLFLNVDDAASPPEISSVSLNYESSRYSLEVAGSNDYTAGIAGVPFEVIIRYVDAEGNLTPDYNGTKTLTFSGPTNSDAGGSSASGGYPLVGLTDSVETDGIDFGNPLSVEFTNGTAMVWMVLYDADETQEAPHLDIKAVSAEGITTSHPLNVTLNPADANKLLWVTEPQNSVAAGADWDAFSVEIVDEYENRLTDNVSTVSITTDEDPFSAGTTSVAAVSGVATLSSPGSALQYTKSNPSLTVTASTEFLTSVTDTVEVTKDESTKQFLVEGIGSSVAGTASTVTVTCQDAYGNIFTDYEGTIAFTSSDTEATLPTKPEDLIFTATDKGTKTFTDAVILRSANLDPGHWVRATDTDGITGVQENILVSAEALAGSSIVLPETKAAGVLIRGSGDVTVSLTVPAETPLPSDGKIVVEFGHDGNTAGDFSFDYEETTAATILSGLDGTLAVSDITDQTVTLTRANGNATSSSADTEVTFQLSGIRNPLSWGSTGTFRVAIQDGDGRTMAEQDDIAAQTIFGIVFQSPASGNSFSVGQQNVPITYTEQGTSNSLLFQFVYVGGAPLICQNDGVNLQSASYTPGGETLQWDIPAVDYLTISSQYYIRVIDTGMNNTVVGVSDFFTISGGIDLVTPASEEKVSYQLPLHITWDTLGDFGSGVAVQYSTDSTNGINGSWKSATVYNTYADALAGGVSDVVNDKDNGVGVGGSGTYWPPSKNIVTARNIWLKISDASNENPPASDEIQITLSNIAAVNFTLPDREGTAIMAGDDLAITGNIFGVSNIKIEYLSKAAVDAGGEGYVLCKNASGASASDLDTSLDLPFNWRVPDDVYPDDGSMIRITATDAADITGEVSKTSAGFTIYGELTRLAPTGVDDPGVQKPVYKVDDATDRVPIIWSGSKSIWDGTTTPGGFLLEYTDSFITPNWQSLSSVGGGEIYDDATAGTAGQYNWDPATGQGTAWWQPRITGPSIWVRVKDVNDEETISNVGFGEDFGISGVSVLGVTATNASDDSDYLTEIEVGSTVYIRGTGTTTVSLFYDTDEDFSDAVPIGSAGVQNSKFAYTWTVPDEISDSIYLVVKDGDDPTINNSSAVPISIKGVLTVKTPDSAWTIGETGNSVTGTVTGDIDEIDLQYTTAADPQEADWTDLLTDFSIGDNSGTGVSDFTIPAESFTVPDAITKDSFKLRVKDSTDGRDAAILAASEASEGFQVKGKIEITSPTSGDTWYVGADETMNYTIWGQTIGDLEIYFGYMSGEEPSDSVGDYTWVDDPEDAVLDTTALGYFGTGIQPADKIFDWSHVGMLNTEGLDIIEQEIGLAADEQDPDVYEQPANRCWMMIKMVSDNAGVEVYSVPFRVEYHKITWSVKNMTGGYLTGLDVTEGPGGEFSLKPNWTVGDESIPEIAGPFDRYYPAFGSQQYTTTFTKMLGTKPVSADKTWLCNTDQTIDVVIDTAPDVVWDVAIDTTYDYSSTILRISSWMQKQGLQLNEAYRSNLGGAYIEIYNDQGVKISDPEGTDPIEDDAADDNGIYYFTWNPTADGVVLARGKQYLVKATIIMSQIPYSASTTFTLESATTYDVQVDTVYNATADSITINTALLEAGNLVTDSSKAQLIYCRVFDTAGNNLTETSGDLSSEEFTEVDEGNAIFHSTWDPAEGISSDTSYTIIAKIEYSGQIYSGTATFSLAGMSDITSRLGDIENKVDTVQTSITGDNGVTSKIDAVQSSVDNVDSDVTALSTAQSTFRTNTTTSLSNIETSVGNIETDVGAILEDTGTTIPDLISAQTTDITDELAKGVISEILTRPTSINPGATATIRYRTATGLSPTITVYDASNNVRVNAAMTEIGSTGIYEYDVTFAEAWGTGDYTIVCSEATTSATDSMVMDVSETNISAIADAINDLTDQVSSVVGTIGTMSPQIDSINRTVLTLLTNLGDVPSLVDAINTATAGIETDVGTINTTTGELSTDLDTLMTSLGSSSDTSSNTTLFGKLAGISTNNDTLIGKLTSVSTDVDTTRTELTSYINNVEDVLGTSTDGSSENTIFGKIASVETDLSAISPSALNAETYARDARTQATEAALTAAEIKKNLLTNNINDVNKALALLPQLAASLTNVQDALNKLPTSVDADLFTDQVRSALKSLGKLAAQKGLESLIPDPDAFNPKDMKDVRNTVTELKSMMNQVRDLLDKEVNKPVIQGWMEEGR